MTAGETFQYDNKVKGLAVSVIDDSSSGLTYFGPRLRLWDGEIDQMLAPFRAHLWIKGNLNHAYSALRHPAVLPLFGRSHFLDK